MPAGRSHSVSCPPVANTPLEAAVALTGGKYKSLILWKLLSGTQRFSQLRRSIPCATAKMLTQQLRELEAGGLIHREVYPVVPPRVEDSLTASGQSIRPVLEAMNTWGKAYLESNQLEIFELE